MEREEVKITLKQIEKHLKIQTAFQKLCILIDDDVTIQYEDKRKIKNE